MKCTAKILTVLLLAGSAGWATERHPATGLVISVDRPHKTLVVSCDTIPNYMEAMVMPFPVREEKLLDGLTPGAMIEFAVVVTKDDAYIEDIRLKPYESVEQEPLQARRLKILENLGKPNPSANSQLTTGQVVPDFTLTDQQRKSISLKQFQGKVVALNFVYTRCPLPQYCFRISNNFGRVQKRFKDRLGRDLILLTVTFDPVHDQPDVLANYARTWKADPATWHFLTGTTADVDRLCNLFGVGFWQDEATLTHSLHTAVIDREGKLVANLEGNQFTPEQLGDLIESVLPPNH